jgi:hypothetical protein
MTIETKLVQRVIEKIDAEDARAVELMSSGNLTNHGEYRYSAGYRKALRDAKTLISETLEEVMKE